MINFNWVKILLIFSPILITSCLGDKADLNRQIVNSFTVFPDSEEANSKVVFNVGMEEVKDLVFLGDTILLTFLRGRSLDHFINVFDLRTKKQIGTLLPRGKGPREAIGATAIDVRDDEIWVRDITKEVVFKMPLDAYKSLQVDTLIKEMPLERHFYDCAFLDDNSLLGVALPFFLGDLTEGNLIELYDYKSDSVLNGYAKLKSNDQTHIGALVDAHSSFISYNESNNRFVVAYRYMDAFEIFNAKSGEKVSDNHGTDNFDIEYEVGQRKTYSYMQDTKDTRESFHQLVTTSGYIYMMYSGMYDSDKSAHLGRSIYVFDWDGNPIKVVNFDQLFQTFTVSEDNSNLYVVDLEGDLLEMVLDLKDENP